MMSANTVDTALAKRMVAADAIRSAAIIGRPGGWTVILNLGMHKTTLCVQRTDKPRMWRSLDRCVDYLRNELNIARFELLDASNHSDAAVDGGNARAAAALRMRDAPMAADHEKWFREQVAQAIKEADDPNVGWVSNEEAIESWAKKRAALAGMAKAGSK